MKTNKLIATISILLIMSSCELEPTMYENMTGSVFPEKPEQLESLTLEAYGQLTHLLDDWGWWLYNQEVTSDFLVFPQRGTDWEDGGKWRVLNRHTWNATTMGVQNMWYHLFAGVTTCNRLLDILRTIDQTEATLKTIAEVEVLRSFFYYLLIDNYGGVPYLESFNDAPESPYRTNREDIHARLISLVEAAIPLLPETNVKGNQKITRGMAWMLLSKLYLNGFVYRGEASPPQADMDSVVSLTNRVIDLGYLSLETNRLAPFAVNNTNSTENIFTTVGDENADDGMRHSFRTLHTLHVDTYDLESSPWNGCAVKPDFYERLFGPNDGFDDPDDNTSVNDEVVDARAAAFLRGQQYAMDGSELSNDNGKLILTREIKADVMNDGSDGAAATRFSGYRVTKFEVEIGSGPIMNNDFPFFRLADAYLMRAEATLRGGTGADASADADLNTIRNLAGLPSVTATLDEVLDERGRELFLEGHRRSDLIRFGKFAERDWWLGADDSDPGVHRLVFMLPQDQIDVNPNLEKDPIPLNIN
jgi:starch-binding outer membrane protein, SusD/RagB family